MTDDHNAPSGRGLLFVMGAAGPGALARTRPAQLDQVGHAARGVAVLLPVEPVIHALVPVALIQKWRIVCCLLSLFAAADAPPGGG